MKFGISEPRVYWDGDTPKPSVTMVSKVFANPFLMQWTANVAADYIHANYVPGEGFYESFGDLCREAKTQYKNVAKEAMEFGTFVHACAEWVNTTHPSHEAGDIVEVELDKQRALGNEFRGDTASAELIIKNLIKWQKKHGVRPIATEKVVFGPNYAGTLDLLCEIDSSAFENARWLKTHKPLNRRVLALVDYKTSKSYYDDMPVKLAAYKQALDGLNYHELLEEAGFVAGVEAMLIVRLDKTTCTVNCKNFIDEYPVSRQTFNHAAKIIEGEFAEYFKSLEQERERQRSTL